MPEHKHRFKLAKHNDINYMKRSAKQGKQVKAKVSHLAWLQHSRKPNSSAQSHFVFLHIPTFHMFSC